MNSHEMRCPRSVRVDTVLDDGRTHVDAIPCPGMIPVPMTPGFVIRRAVCPSCQSTFETGRAKTGQTWFTVTFDQGAE